ncbi:unnamed protein product [Vitrella brassicaformis CCMP3155]|uniref:Ubiquitin-like domain-containing protein n=1 Tax=Vitrella brassicaformis (strain CCMP3155) TaxID=1169540 RepID=A0A0G4F698_VITBC|nr:unnamed protein product [Vitrella brassicaformis CCMP3155]|eukprot:CEM07630.1 unnamed protein product [Vitrella brassicaformis CCMP3155]
MPDIHLRTSSRSSADFVPSFFLQKMDVIERPAPLDHDLPSHLASYYEQMCTLQWADVIYRLKVQGYRVCDVREAVRDWLLFMLLKVRVNDRRGRLMLPAHLDIVWREALLFPRMYLSMCQMLDVNIINHDPLHEELSEWERQARRTMAGTVATAWCGTVTSSSASPPRHIIGDGTPHHIKRANKRFITIYLRRISGEQTAYSVTADGVGLVDELRLAVQESEGIEMSRQRIVCHGQELQDGHTLGEYRMTTHNTVAHLVVRLPNNPGEGIGDNNNNLNQGGAAPATDMEGGEAEGSDDRDNYRMGDW